MAENAGNEACVARSRRIVELAERYLGSLRRRNYSRNSVSTYAWALADFEGYLGRRGISALRNVMPPDLDAYRLDLVGRPMRPASVEVVLRGVRQFFAFLCQEQALFVNPAEGLVIPKPSRRLLRVPSEAEVIRMLEAASDGTPIGCRNRAILETAYGAALRVGEMAGMTLDGLRLDDGTVRIMGKGARERLTPLGERAVQWIRLYLAEARTSLLGSGNSERLWIGKFGIPLETPGLSVVIRASAASAGVMGISPHSLRRACATHMLDHGADPVILQQMLGHSSLRHLSQYLEVTIRDLKATHARTRPGQ